jgi:hypothetical protein
MDWIKKNPAQMALAVVALGVIAASYFLWTEISAFPGNFEASHNNPTLSKGIGEIDTKPLAEAAKGIATPSAWTANMKEQGSLFASKAFVRKGDSTRIESPEGGMLNPPVPNAWLEKYGFDYLNPEVLNEDPDRDGFNNHLEYLGMDAKDGTEDSTDPTKPESHPPYESRITLAKGPTNPTGIVLIPFRLKLMSYDINPRNPNDITVAINTIDRGGRTKFVTVGEDIPETNYKTEKFTKKEIKQPDGTVKDESELIIINKKNPSQKIPLVLLFEKNSPESFLVLRYLWTQPGSQPTPDMNLKKDEEFKLPPEATKPYKVLDIKAPGPQGQPPGEVKIQLPSGKELILKTDDPALPR